MASRIDDAHAFDGRLGFVVALLRLCVDMSSQLCKPLPGHFGEAILATPRRSLEFLLILFAPSQESHFEGFKGLCTSPYIEMTIGGLSTAAAEYTLCLRR